MEEEERLEPPAAAAPRAAPPVVLPQAAAQRRVAPPAAAAAAAPPAAAAAAAPRAVVSPPSSPSQAARALGTNIVFPTRDTPPRIVVGCGGSTCCYRNGVRGTSPGALCSAAAGPVVFRAGEAIPLTLQLSLTLVPRGGTPPQLRPGVLVVRRWADGAQTVGTARSLVKVPRPARMRAGAGAAANVAPVGVAAIAASDEQVELTFRATRDIRAHEELVVDYGA